MPPRTFYLGEQHEEDLEDLCKHEIRKPSQMIQVLITRAKKAIKRGDE